MILRRLTDAFRKQDWFTVGVETLIVVLGVFLGIQLGNWNDDRAEQVRAQDYRLRLRTELLGDVAQLEAHREVWEEIAKQGYTAIRYAETKDLGGATEWEILRSFLHASQSWQFSFVDATYSELSNAGELRLAGDGELRTALSDYYVLTAARRGGAGPYNLLPVYRERVRGRMHSDIMRYYWEACFKQAAGVQLFYDCPPPEDSEGVSDILTDISGDSEIVDALRYWIDTQRMAVELVGFDIGRAQALVARLGEQK